MFSVHFPHGGGFCRLNTTVVRVLHISNVKIYGSSVTIWNLASVIGFTCVVFRFLWLVYAYEPFGG